MRKQPNDICKASYKNHLVCNDLHTNMYDLDTVDVRSPNAIVCVYYVNVVPLFY